MFIHKRNLFSIMLIFPHTHTHTHTKELSSELCGFLSKLTLENRKEKDQFFLDLPRELHSLPQVVVAENVVPLLISPLVMAEPLARDSLWKHLLNVIHCTCARDLLCCPDNHPNHTPSSIPSRLHFNCNHIPDTLSSVKP